MKELITFKGSNHGLNLVIDKQADFDQIQEAIKQKLASCPNFFEPNTILFLEDRSFSNKEKEILVNIFNQYRLTLKILSVDELKQIMSTSEKLSMKDMIIERTVRGGEEIICKGSIIIQGNVNPGAKIIAGGNIDVHGHCRGIVHAGAYGDSNAYIIADNLSPLQIRIAQLIARAPDNTDDDKRDICTEKAMVKDNNIVLEPYVR